MNFEMSSYVKSSYFDILDIKVDSNQIWTGISNPTDPRAQADLVENLYKIAIALVNSKLARLGFDTQIDYIAEIVLKALEYYTEDPHKHFLNKFPAPPSTTIHRKQIYDHVRRILEFRMIDKIRRHKKAKENLEKLVEAYDNIKEQVPPEKQPWFVRFLPGGRLDMEALELGQGRELTDAGEDQKDILNGLYLIYLLELGVHRSFIRTLSALKRKEENLPGENTWEPLLQEFVRHFEELRQDFVIMKERPGGEKKSPAHLDAESIYRLDDLGRLLSECESKKQFFDLVVDIYRNFRAAERNKTGETIDTSHPNGNHE
jgi:hypothetical protein